MKRLFIFFLFVLCFSIAYETKAQQLVIRMNEPFISSDLSGIITDRNGDIIAGVSVKRYGSGWKKLLNSTSTDENGRFKFSRIPAGLYFLRLTYTGFQEMEIKVRVIKKSKKKLVFKMEVAT